MKIAGQVVQDPHAESALQKLSKGAGRNILEDGDVQTAEEANDLLNVVRDWIVNEEDFQGVNALALSGKSQKLTRQEFSALAREFQSRFPRTGDSPGFVGLSRFFAASPLKSSGASSAREKHIESRMDASSVLDLAWAVLFLSGDSTEPVLREAPSWASEILRIGDANQRSRLLRAAAVKLGSNLEKMSDKQKREALEPAAMSTGFTSLAPHLMGLVGDILEPLSASAKAELASSEAMRAVGPPP